MQKENDLDSWRLLFRVAELGSIARAAEEIGIEPSSASRRLITLEKSVGCDLLMRTTRTAGLTRAGRQVCDRMMELISTWDGLIAEVRSQSDLESGLIRVSSPVGFGQEILTPLVVRFQQEHPQLVVEISLRSRPADPRRDNIDVVLCYRPIDDESLVARRLRSVEFMICASPSYLSTHGCPQHPRELAQHHVLLYRGDYKPPTTQVFRGEESEPVRAAASLRINSAVAIKQAAIAGAGICVDLPQPLCAEALRSGALVQILPEWRPASHDIYAVRVATRHPAPHITRFLDWLSNEIAG